MRNHHNNDPMHGVTLKKILTDLLDHYGWGELGIHVKIRCFNDDPSIKSSLAFLRKTPWARSKVERLYLEMMDEKNDTKPKDPWDNLKIEGLNE